MHMRIWVSLTELSKVPKRERGREREGGKEEGRGKTNSKLGKSGEYRKIWRRESKYIVVT